MDFFDEKKVGQALLYIATRVGAPVSKLVALKLLFLADRYHLRKYARAISGDDYFAMRLGPVASKTKTLIERLAKSPAKDGLAVSVVHRGRKKYETLSVSGQMKQPFRALSETDKEALDVALNLRMLHEDLVEFSHCFPEWKRCALGLETKSRVKMKLVDFFLPAPPSVEYCDVSADDVALSREVFIEDMAI